MNEYRPISAESQHNFIFYPNLTQKLLNRFLSTIFLHDEEQLVELINAHIRKAMMHFVSEHDSKKWRRSILTSAKIAQN